LDKLNILSIVVISRLAAVGLHKLFGSLLLFLGFALGELVLVEPPDGVARFIEVLLIWFGSLTLSFIIELRLFFEHINSLLLFWRVHLFDLSIFFNSLSTNNLSVLQSINLSFFSIKPFIEGSLDSFFSFWSWFSIINNIFNNLWLFISSLM
jgi:hypothetical protein